MTENETLTMNTEEATVNAPEAPVAVAEVTDAKPEEKRRGRGARGQRGGGRRQAGARERSEFDQATIEVRRVARVMAGGRRFSFSVSLVLGDKRGRVGVGIGKAGDTALAIDKAVRDAKKNMITVPRTKDNSIRHAVSTKYSSSIVTIIPSPGRGLVAGSAIRTVLEYAGVENVVAKILTRTKNKLTIARATIAALSKLPRS